MCVILLVGNLLALETHLSVRVGDQLVCFHMIKNIVFLMQMQKAWKKTKYVLEYSCVLYFVWKANQIY